ncbi:MAG: hypothetical protein PHZ00_00955 [Candidatus Peribacteraceae bacterium]|nr:hypothetical protein [Candidatus Peribacteraceae bacterium]
MPPVSRTLALPAFSKQRVLIFSILWLLSVAPFFLLHSQWITGPFVNAVLILATVILGPAEAMVIGLFPSAIALASGLLPLPLAPMVPFIMIGNAVYVGVFHAVRRIPRKPKNPTIPRNNEFSSDSSDSLVSSVSSIIIASVTKFLFLFLAAKFLIAPLLTGPITKTLITMMGWPQLATALIGGAIALGILTQLRTNQRSQ